MASSSSGAPSHTKHLFRHPFCMVHVLYEQGKIELTATFSSSLYIAAYEKHLVVMEDMSDWGLNVCMYECTVGRILFKYNALRLYVLGQ